MVILGELAASPSIVTSDAFGGAGEQVANQAVVLARRSASRYASLVLAGTAINAFLRGDFPLGRELAREAIPGVRISPHPGAVLALSFVSRLRSCTPWLGRSGEHGEGDHSTAPID
jgi:hypothetical protein